MSRTPTPPSLERLSYTAAAGPEPSLPDLSTLPPAVVERVESSLLDGIEDGVIHALRRKDLRAYMEALATAKPDLFFKYVQLAIEGKRAAQAPSRVGSILSPLAPTALDRPPGA